MLTKSVYFSQRPDRAIVNRIGRTYTCRVDFPVDVQEVVSEDGSVQYKADVYSVDVGYTDGLAARIEAHYDEWLAMAKETPVLKPTPEERVAALEAENEQLKEALDMLLSGVTDDVEK